MDPEQAGHVLRVSRKNHGGPDKPSIAVLPFTNMSGDSEQEYFADGITQDIITALSKYRWLGVIARNSTFSYKGQSADAKRVANDLGAKYVIEGSVRRAPDRVRVTAQLIDAESGNHLWAERYDRNLDDIFDVQDEITDTIVATIEPEVVASERQKVERGPRKNLRACSMNRSASSVIPTVVPLQFVFYFPRPLWSRTAANSKPSLVSGCFRSDLPNEANVAKWLRIAHWG